MTRADVINKWIAARRQSYSYSSSETDAACIVAAGAEWAAMRQAQIALMSHPEVTHGALDLARNMMED